jgi:hypothetical protein
MKHSDLRQEEYEVYSSALRKLHFPNEDELFVFRERTQSSRMALIDQMMTDDAREADLRFRGDATELMRLDFPEIATETVNDFLEKNKAGGVVEPRFPFGGPQKALSSVEEGHFWNDTTHDQLHDAWNRFYKQFPKAAGIFTFSRVGFDSGHTEALVEIAVSSGSLFGRGIIIYLKKSPDGTWVPRKESVLWLA